MNKRFTKIAKKPLKFTAIFIASLLTLSQLIPRISAYILLDSKPGKSVFHSILINYLIVVGAIVAGSLIIRLILRPKLTDTQWDKRSGNGRKSEVPKEIKGWNWGAAGLGLVWSAYYRLPFTLIMVIPIFNLAFFILLAAYGNEWAWRRNKWRSADEFLAAQSVWRPWGISFFVIMIMLILNLIVRLDPNFVA